MIYEKIKILIAKFMSIFVSSKAIPVVIPVVNVATDEQTKASMQKMTDMTARESSIKETVKKAEISQKMDLLIEGKNLQFVYDAMQAGYTPSIEQSDKIIRHSLDQHQESLYKYFPRNSNQKKEKSLGENIVVYMAKNNQQSVLSYAAASCNEKFCEKEDYYLRRLDKLFDFKEVKPIFTEEILLNLIKNSKPHFYSDDSIESVKKLYQEFIMSSDLLFVIKETYEVESIPKNLPDYVEKSVQTINQLIKGVETDNLSESSKAELKSIVAKNLPEILNQYSVIDSKIMSYKNENNETVEGLLRENIKAITDRLEEIASEATDNMARAHIKEIKINTKHMRQAKL